MLSPAQYDALIDTLQENGRAGTRHLMSNPAVTAIAHDPRLLKIAGATAIPHRATLFHKTSKAN